MEVTKRDGTIEEFDQSKLRRCIAHAMRECRYDPQYAQQLSQAVAIHLQNWERPKPPSTEYIYRCVRTVLRDTGLRDVARKIGAHRRERLVSRRRIKIRDAGTGARRPWQKCDVVATLESQHGLSRSVSRILGGEIERRVIGLEYPSISTELIAELLRNELVAWGLAEDAVSASTEAGPPTKSAEPELE